MVASNDEKGGTWAGALEDLRHRWVPLFVRADLETPPGNRKLLELGGLPLTLEDLRSSPDLRALLDQRAASGASSPLPARAARAGVHHRAPDQPRLF